MSEYVFQPGQVVAIVRGKKVEALLTVLRQAHGVVWLEDDTAWYAASGLPVSGSSVRRVTALNHALEAQIQKKASLLRIAELATVLVECADKRSRLRSVDLDRVEAAMRTVLKGRTACLAADGREAFWARVEARLEEAERGAVDRVKYDLEIS
tara:strand:- start:202 stop:660 length:459 start_codon:yes stop_codon:yes gene_type:complete